MIPDHQWFQISEQLGLECIFWLNYSGFRSRLWLIILYTNNLVSLLNSPTCYHAQLSCECIQLIFLQKILSCSKSFIFGRPTLQDESLTNKNTCQFRCYWCKIRLHGSTYLRLLTLSKIYLPKTNNMMIYKGPTSTDFLFQCLYDQKNSHGISTTS